MARRKVGQLENVVAVRLSDATLRVVDKLAKETQLDRSAVIRFVLNQALRAGLHKSLVPDTDSVPAA